ncbi:Myotubularin-related protein 2 [Phytophthora citrophthora]|uniref:phosphatidylinositol-3,5-bisphosphate 3-phosphatase n=1 Tax=Phytophthora citrophthora TaxID=4793 RepID=A0AAD9LCG9_9STRA|nr:Myotubularin-related protein 2 [Phytophthora citrophthora]
MLLKIIRAEALAAADLNGKSDPYVKVFYDGKEVASSPRVKRSLNPRWDFEVTITLVHAGPLDVELEVLDKDELSSSDLLGALRVPFPEWREVVEEYQKRKQQRRNGLMEPSQRSEMPPTSNGRHRGSKCIDVRQIHGYNTGEASYAVNGSDSKLLLQKRESHPGDLQTRSRSLNSSGGYLQAEAKGRASVASGELLVETMDDAMDIKPVLIWCRLVKGPAAQGRILCSVQYEEKDLKYLVNNPYGTSIQEVYLPQNQRFEHAYCHLPRSWHPDVAVRQDELTAMHAGTPKDCLFPWHEKLLHMVEEVTVTFHVNESNQGVLATLVLTNYRIWFVPYRRVRGLLHEDVHTLPVSKILKASIQQQKRSNNNVITVLILDNMDAGHYHVTLSPISRLRDSVRDFSREAELKRVKTLHNIVREIDWLRIENSFCSPTDRNHTVATADEMQFEMDLLQYTPKHGSSSMPPSMARALTTQYSKYQKHTFSKGFSGDNDAMDHPKFKQQKSDSSAQPQLSQTQSMRKPPQHFQPAARRRIRYDPEVEFTRQGALDHPRWRKCDLNEQYKLCPTYPAFLMVPECLNDEIIKAAAGFRSKSRFPALTWIHPRTGAPLCRSSQPNTGVLRSTNPEDKKLIWAIRDAALPADQAARSKASMPKKKASVVHIVDARPEINAKSNALAGKGHESVKQYDRDGVSMAAITFMGIDNIHVVRNSLAGLGQALYEVEDSNFFGAVQKSRWLEHICSILQGASEVATHLERGEAVLVHCSDGWDRTAQLSALAQMMLDPYFRTLEGFALLIEKDWCSFGHNFQKRCSHPTSDQTSPIFLQFIDAVYQLTLQFPTHFQFNELLLSSVAEAAYSSWYGTFQKNSECERREFLSTVASASVWDVIRATTDQFLNPLFSGGEVRASTGSNMEPMIPVCRVRVMQLWVSQYQKAIGHMRLQQREFEMLQLIRQQEADLSRLYAALSSEQQLELRAGQLKSDIAKLSRSMNLRYPDEASTPSKEPEKKRLMASSGGETRRNSGKRTTAASLDFHDLASIVAMGTAGAAARSAAPSPSPPREHMTLAQLLQRANIEEGPPSTAATAIPSQSHNLPNPRRRKSISTRSRSNSLKNTLINVVAQMKGGSHDKDADEPVEVGSATLPNPVRVSEGRRNQRLSSPSRRDELKRDLHHLETQLSKLNNQVQLKEESARQTMRRFRCYNYNLPETALLKENDTLSPRSGKKVRLGGSNGSKSYPSPRTSSPPLSSSSSPGSASTSLSAGISGDLGDSSSFDGEPRNFTPGSSPLLGTDKVISGGNYLNSQPVWERDEDAPCCKRCKKKFKTLLRNRHHCRCCGYVFCGRCTSHRMSLPDFGYYDVVRVCKVCYNSGEDG